MSEAYPDSRNSTFLVVIVSGSRHRVSVQSQRSEKKMRQLFFLSDIFRLLFDRNYTKRRKHFSFSWHDRGDMGEGTAGKQACFVAAAVFVFRVCGM